MHWYVSYRTGGSTVMHIFKRKEHAITAACKFSITVIAMRSKSDQCWDPWKETCSTSGTSGGSGIKTRAQRRPIQPLGRYRRQAQEPDTRHPARRGISDVKVGRTGRLTQCISFKLCRPEQQEWPLTAASAPALRFSHAQPLHHLAWCPTSRGGIQC
jgi:hypothetical protein